MGVFQRTLNKKEQGLFGRMTLPVGCILCSVFFPGAFSFSQEADAWLSWKNGDSLKGKMLPSERGDVVCWKSELFEDPFEIRIGQLQMVRFGSDQKLEDGGEAFRITLKTGDVVTANLVSISADLIKIQSPRLHGGEAFDIPRANVASLERMNSPNLVFAGPNSQRGWKSVTRERKVSDWVPTPEGRLGTRRWHADLFYPFKHPEKFEVEFNVQSLISPLEFSVGFFLDPEVGPAIETWDDMLVLHYGNEFEPIMKVSDGTKNLRFKIFWDQKTGLISVHDAGGKRLAKLEGVKGPLPKSNANTNRRRSTTNRSGTPTDQGFALLNKTTDLYLGDLRIRKWNGIFPPEIEVNQPRIELADGGAIYQEIASVNGGILKTSGGKSEPVGEIEHIVFDLNPRNPNLPEKPEERDVYVAWLDGTVLSGKLQNLDGQNISILPPWSPEPVSAKLGGSRKIAFFGNEEAEGGATDQLIIGNLKLNGRIAPGSNEGGEQTLVNWRPAGAENASALAPGSFSRLIRAEPAGGVMILGHGRVYLENNEVLTGKLLSIDGKKIHFQSEYTDQIDLDPKDVRAIDIEAAAGELKGFGDSGWELFPDEVMGQDSVTLEKDKVVLKKGSFGHRSLLAGDEITFDAEWKQPYVGSVTLRLFVSDFETSTPSTDILIAAQSSRLYVGESQVGGQFNFSGEQIPMTNGKVKIQIQHRGNRLQVKVNDTRALTVTLDPAKQSGNGLLFKEGGGFNRSQAEVTLTNFEVKRTSGYLPTRVIDPDAKKEILRIPRFRRDNPASHVLIAPNGDLLRGKLIAASGENVRFSSKLDTFDFPRERVSTIVWLKPAADTDEEVKAEGDQKKAENPKEPFKPTHRFILHDGSRLMLKAKEINRDRFIGESELLGDCEVPLRSVREIRHGPESNSEKSQTGQVAYADWVLEKAPEPVIPTGDGGETSPLVGKVAKDFRLGMLDGGEFKLSGQQGKVVVLDFWATWCGPCIRAMPEIFQGIAPFGDNIAFLAVNQGETPPIIEQFLDQRGWTGTPVGLDAQQKVGDQFQVQGIPHTVVIGKTGKIAWVHSGYKDGMGKDLANAIAKALQE